MVWPPHRLDKIRIQRLTQVASTDTDALRGGCSVVKVSAMEAEVTGTCLSLTLQSKYQVTGLALRG